MKPASLIRFHKYFIHLYKNTEFPHSITSISLPTLIPLSHHTLLHPTVYSPPHPTVSPHSSTLLPNLSLLPYFLIPSFTPLSYLILTSHSLTAPSHPTLSFHSLWHPLSLPILAPHSLVPLSDLTFPPLCDVILPPHSHLTFSPHISTPLSPLSHYPLSSIPLLTHLPHPTL